MIAGERRVIDVATRRRRDAVGTSTTRRLPYFHVVRLQVDAAVVAALAGKPDVAFFIERQRVQIRIAGVGRQRPFADFVRFRIDAHDRVLSAVGDPRCTVGTDDDAMRRRSASERDFLVTSRLGIENAELAGALRGVIHRPAGGGRGRDVMRPGARRDIEITGRRGGVPRARQRDDEQKTSDWMPSRLPHGEILRYVPYFTADKVDAGKFRPPSECWARKPARRDRFSYARVCIRPCALAVQRRIETKTLIQENRS